MNYYAALDVSLRSVHLCVMDENGEIHAEGQVDSEPQDVDAFLRKLALEITTIGLEAGTLFVYILLMNLMGLLPLMKSSTSSWNTTVALALCVFCYVQYTGIRKLGAVGYLDHMCGQPRDIVAIIMVPLMLPLHIMEELAKPLSLSLRLFGNVTGEDVLIAIFVGLGVASLGFLHLPIGLPLHVPFIFLALLTSTIQALVFTLLSTVYFSMMLPHEAHGEAHPGREATHS